MERLERHDLERLSSHLGLKFVEAAEVSIHWRGRNRHSFNRMFLVVKGGSGKNFIKNHSSGTHMPMREGCIYFIPGNADMEFSFRKNMQFISFHFHLELFGRFDVFSMQQECICLTRSKKIILELENILQTGSGLATQCRLQGAVMSLASEVLSLSSTSDEKLIGIAHKYSALFDFIQSHALATTTIDELAAVAGMSRDALSREFSHDCGVTLKKYLSQAIVRHAEDLLLLPSATARSVAFELGFNNEYYFSRFFKKNTGRPPGEYRRLSGQE